MAMARSPPRAHATGDAGDEPGGSPFAGEWASPYRSGQMRSGQQQGQQPVLPSADHSAHRRRRGGGAGSNTSSPSHGYVRTTPPRTRTAAVKSSPGRPPIMAGQHDYSDSPSGLGAALNGALGTLDHNARPISPTKGDIATGDESQLAAHEFRGLWSVSEKKRQKAEAECFQRKRENEQLKERLTTLEGRLRGTLESSGGAKSELRETQAQLQGLEAEFSQLRLEHTQLQRDNAGLAAARDEQAHRLRATEDALESERQRAGAAESALSAAESDRRSLAESQRHTAAELAAAASGSQQANAEAKRQLETERRRASAAAAASAEQIAAQETELAKVRDEVTQYALALGTAQQREGELQRELNGLQGQLVSEQNSATQAHRELDAMHHALAVKEAEVVAANQGRHQLEAAAATAQGSLESARRDHAGAISERGRLEAALAAEKDNVRRERENADRAREKRRGLEEQLRRVEAGAEAARREANAAKEQQAVAEKEASTHAASLLASRTELREARDAKENAEDVAARLREEVDTAKREVAEKRALADESSAALVEREAELSALQREEEELRRLQQDEAQRLLRQSEALAAAETTIQQLRTELEEEKSSRAAEQAQSAADKRTWEDQQESMTQEQTALTDRLGWMGGRLEELAGLQADLEELLAEQRALSDELEATREDCSVHEVQLQELTSQLGAAEQQRDQAVDAQQAAATAAADWQEKHAAAVEAARTATEAMTASASEVTHLRVEVERMKAEVDSSSASVAHANEKTEELQKQIMAQQTEWHERERAEHTAHSSRLAETESSRKLVEEQLRNTQNALDAAQAVNQQCRDEVARSSQTADAAQQRLLAVEAQVRDLAHAKEIVEGSLQSCRETVAEAQARVTQLEVEVREADARAAASEASASAIQTERDAAEKDLRSKWETCEIEKRELQGEMARVRGVAAAAEAEKRIAEQEATRARAAATGEAGRRAAAEQRAATAEAAVVLCEAANATVEKELAEATKRWETALSEQEGETGMVRQSESQLRVVVASERAAKRSAEAALVASEQRSQELEAQLTESRAELAAQAQLLEAAQRGTSGTNNSCGADVPGVGSNLVSREEFASLISDWKMANDVLEKLQAECLAHAQTEAELREALAVAQQAAQAAAAAAAAVPVSTGPDQQTLQRLESLQAELAAAQASEQQAAAAEKAAYKRCTDEVTAANAGKNAVVADM